MTTGIEQLKALVAAGEKAVQPEWAWERDNPLTPSNDYLLADTGEMVMKDGRISHTGAFGKRRKANREFMVAAANSRATIAAALEVVEAAKEYLPLAREYVKMDTLDRRGELPDGVNLVALGNAAHRAETVLSAALAKLTSAQGA